MTWSYFPTIINFSLPVLVIVKEKQVFLTYIVFEGVYFLKGLGNLVDSISKNYKINRNNNLLIFPPFLTPF